MNDLQSIEKGFKKPKIRKFVPEPVCVPVPDCIKKIMPESVLQQKMNFDHEKLDVYKAAIELTVLIDDIVEQIPKGRAYLIDQLQRAGTSVPLNIAEGAGEYSTNEKSRFYRMAKRSATEYASIFDICHQLKLIEVVFYTKARELLLRIVAMLTKMARITN